MSLFIKNARVVAGGGEPALAGASVRIDGDRISALGTQLVPEAGDDIIDAGGRVLLPGLFDMHVHLGPWDGGLHLAAGVTTVRDMGAVNAVLAGYVAQIEGGRAIGPRVVPAGFIEGASEYKSSGGFTATSLDDVRSSACAFSAIR